MNTENNISRSRFRPVIITVTVLCLMGLSYFGGIYTSSHGNWQQSADIFQGQVLNKPTKVADVDFSLFWQVWDTLKRDYVDQGKLTDKKLFYGALSGIVSAADDPYSVFMNPEEAKAFQDDLSGSFEGIGAEIGSRDNALMVISPLEDSPAIKAGVRAGDKIFAIDGKNTANLTVDEAVKKIRGPKGTTVKLTLVRDKVPEPIQVTITRDTVIVKSVKTSFDEKNKLFTIKISSFNGDTEGLFNQAVIDALAKKPKGIILDLRNNPGGYLETAVAVGSEWVKQGPIVIEQFGDGRKIEHASTGGSRLNGIPTVVLINGGSASASEIVAGALKDYGLAKLVGEKSFGKGSVQVLRQLPDGSVLKVTTAKWLTPKGNSINEQGIEPDTKIEFSLDDRKANKDPQLDQAIKILSGGK